MKRRWFQIHLSTAIILMLAAATLLWFNTCEIYQPAWDGSSYWEVSPFGLKQQYGWPFSAVDCFENFASQTDPITGKFNKIHATSIEYRPLPLAANIAIALSVLAAVAVGCEWGLSRRER